MEEKDIAFSLPKLPKNINKTIRFSDDLVERVETAICGTGYSFSSFIVLATEFALAHMKNLPEKEEKQDD